MIQRRKQLSNKNLKKKLPSKIYTSIILLPQKHFRSFDSCSLGFVEFPYFITMRRLPSQIPETVSRLLKSTYILTPPVWYQAVLANPPPILPARRSRARPSLDQSTGDREPGVSVKRKAPAYTPQEIVYEEDRVRRQFFRDFPFEALRPASLVEDIQVRAINEVDGPGWTSLEQRGAFPSVEK